MIKLINGEALEELDKLIEAGVKVDAIICDPPYGILNNDGRENFSDVNWDNKFDNNLLFEKLRKIRKSKKSNILLFGVGKFATELKMDIQEYKYSIIWDKMQTGIATFKDYQPLKKYEEIMVFYDDLDFLADNEKYREVLKIINDKRKKLKITLKDINLAFGVSTSGGGMASNLLGENKRDLTFMNEKQKNILKKLNLIDNETEKLLEEIEKELKEKISDKRTYNSLDENEKLKTDLISFQKITTNAVHPTQKPIELMEYLIKTYTNEGDIVLDFTMGSGTTGIACKRLNRGFIGIELDENYFKIAQKRIENEQMNEQGFKNLNKRLKKGQNQLF